MELSNSQKYSVIIKNHYLLVQTADILRQIFEQGHELIRGLKAGLKEISSRILESFRRDPLTSEDIIARCRTLQRAYLLHSFILKWLESPHFWVYIQYPDVYNSKHIERRILCQFQLNN